MKTINIILSVIVVFTSCPASAGTITAIQNGNWNTKTTWDLRRVPDDNDVVIIPSARTVLLKNTPYAKKTNTRPVLQINIYGILDFSDNGSDKLYLNEGSKIQIYLGGKIVTSSGSTEVIAIYDGVADNTLWVGSPENILGPVIGLSSTAGFLNSILPMKLTSFEAIKSKDGSINLTWSTSEETNTSHFEIETLLPRDNEWKYAGKVVAAGNSTIHTNYSFTISHLATGTNQFRLKQVDADGRFTYSMIKTVLENGANSMSLWYDPKSKAVHLTGLTGNPGKTSIDLYDLNGINRFHHEYTSAAQSFRLPVTIRGIYIVRINIDPGTTLTRQLLIK